MYYGKSNKNDLLKEDMATNKFQLFFEILGVRFWDLVKLNLILVVFALPLVLWTALNINLLNTALAGSADVEFGALFKDVWLQYVIGLIPCLLILSPVLAGANYVLRKYANDQHAWLWSDLKEHSLSNIKQSLILSLIIGVSLYIITIVLQMYNALVSSYQYMLIFEITLIIFYALFLLSMVFAYPMMVTYKLKLGQILKNSVLLALANLPILILFWIIVLFPLVVLVFISFTWVYALLIAGLYYALFGTAFSLFIFNTFTNGVFRKYMKQDEESKPDDNQTDGNETGQIEE